MRHPPRWVLPLCPHTSDMSSIPSHSSRCWGAMHRPRAFSQKNTCSGMEPTTNHLTYAFSKMSIDEARELSPGYSNKLSALSEPTKAMSNCSVNRLQPISVWLHRKPYSQDSGKIREKKKLTLTLVRPKAGEIIKILWQRGLQQKYYSGTENCFKMHIPKSLKPRKQTLNKFLLQDSNTEAPTPSPLASNHCLSHPSHPSHSYLLCEG